jgi:hypothetical protein
MPPWWSIRISVSGSAVVHDTPARLREAVGLDDARAGAFRARAQAGGQVRPADQDRAKRRQPGACVDKPAEHRRDERGEGRTPLGLDRGGVEPRVDRHRRAEQDPPQQHHQTSDMRERETAEPAVPVGGSERRRRGRDRGVDRPAVKLDEPRRPARTARGDDQDDLGVGGRAVHPPRPDGVERDRRSGAAEEHLCLGWGQPVVDGQEGGAGSPGLRDQVEPRGPRLQ